MVPSLTELFPDEDFRFHLHLRRGDTEAFFRPRQPSMLAERNRLLTTNPRFFCGCTDDGAALVDDAELLLAAGLPAGAGSPLERLIHLGSLVEPDFALLKNDGKGDPLLLAGCVCFPTGWAPDEKFGRRLDRIHETVPDLNATLGRKISTFLERLEPGMSFERVNWGLAATDAWSLHPRLNPPRLTATTPSRSIWLRVEDQILVALSTPGNLLFGLRIRLIPWSEIAACPPAAKGLARALRTLPENVARYKGLAEIRSRLANELEGP